DAWRQGIGMSVTHLSRGEGSITNGSQEAGFVTIHVHYARLQREHPLWEFRTEVRSMTLPEGLTREDLIVAVKARQLLQDQEEKADREAFAADGPVWATAEHGTGSTAHNRSVPGAP
ncbi:MAG: hypothetical protein ACRDJE_01080, partial [Dehalococcoidia bacterium]